MCSPYVLSCKKLLRWLKQQRGAFSPFMFGLLMGLTLFSSNIGIYADRELEKLEERRMALEQARAQDVRQALEYSILAEGTEFSADLDLNRALTYAEGAGVRTRGGQDLHVVVREGKEEYGLRSKQALITMSDDPLLRAQMEQLADGQALQDFAGPSDRNVVLFDSSAARREQVETSIARLEQVAEIVYGFYANELRMPYKDEYIDEIEGQLSLTDTWGRPFDYFYLEDDFGQLEFTTPWGYTHSHDLDLRRGN